MTHSLPFNGMTPTSLPLLILTDVTIQWICVIIFVVIIIWRPLLRLLRRRRRHGITTPTSCASCDATCSLRDLKKTCSHPPSPTTNTHAAANVRQRPPTPAQTPVQTPAQTPVQTPVQTPAQTPANTHAGTNVAEKPRGRK